MDTTWLITPTVRAALRYQLGEFDADDPRYGAVVLDEAFDKADADYTRMAMEIFVAFGFQMILATPGKLLQTLEPYIGAVTVVTNPDHRSSQLANAQSGRYTGDRGPLPTRDRVVWRTDAL